MPPAPGRDFDDNRLAKSLGHFLGHDPRHGIGIAAGAKAVNDPQGTVREFLRHCRQQQAPAQWQRDK